MSTFVKKTGGERSADNAERSRQGSKTSEETSSIADHRPAAAAQKTLSTDLGNSARVQSQVQLQRAVDQSSISQLKSTLQRAGVEEELPMQGKRTGEEDCAMQGKFDAVQRTGPEDELQMKADPLQRAAEEEEPMQGKFDAVQRAGPEDELQMKADPTQRAAEEEEPMQGKFDTVQRKEKENKTGMPDHLKAGVEQLSGTSLDDVEVHYNSASPAQVQALAYTQGKEIHVGPGQEKHLPHEAWHVTQQSAGRVKPTIQAAGMPINDDAALENEADLMGAKAMQAKRDPATTRPTR